jgi:hypothetical protein
MLTSALRGYRASMVRKSSPFVGMVTWPRAHYKRMTIGDLVRKLEELAA